MLEGKMSRWEIMERWSSVGRVMRWGGGGILGG